ncbi:MAG TPA: universal stress protein, partial [Methanosarcina sp.]|nr:universal stress protein [Methanosarcina sp.]
MTSHFYQSIVIATDGSDNTQRAISYGIEIAKLSRATVYALHVVDTSSFSQSWTAGREAMYEILRKDGQKATSKIKEYGEASGVEVIEVLLEGHPSNEIIDFAENNNIDLIVMGTLGKTGLDRFLMGSVAEKVVR